MPDTPQFKSISSIPAPKTSSFPGFKSPLPEKNIGVGEPLKIVPEGVLVKTTSNTSPQDIAKAKATFTKPASREAPQQKPHADPHGLKHIGDQSFWASLLTILAIPVLLLLALFDIIIKAAPWATGPS
jgi:hypothetical protein